MAPDSLETDCPVSGADLGDPAEAAAGQTLPSLPLSLFQIVCLQDARKNLQPTTATV
jgi:hypothetical protein